LGGTGVGGEANHKVEKGGPVSWGLGRHLKNKPWKPLREGVKGAFEKHQWW